MEKEENSSSNILVICRFRPLSVSEIEYSPDTVYSLEEDHKTVKMMSQYETEPQKFTFDYIFESDSSQLEVYEYAAKPIVDAVMQGFNGTVFAYGQTSSGKTFTMTGMSLDDDLMGIIPRMVHSVFEKIEQSESWIEFSVKVSFFEIYLEKLRDLLDPSKVHLKIHEDRTKGIFISELTEKYVSNKQQVFNLMKQGLENRAVGTTNMNQQSSRSHSLFSIVISQSNKKDYISKSSKFYLVDLAGSEKVSKTSAVGQRLEEAKNINKSLTMLGLVINSLTDGKSTHIPYRDSKLTRVLQDSLGGNSKTSLIITCSPSVYNESETLSTLRFGARAKCIKNKPRINREFTVAELKIMLIRCREEIERKDKKIRVLEESLTVSSRRFSVDTKDESVNISEIVENSGFEEIIAELEDTRTKLAEEVQVSLKVRQELELKEDEVNHHKAISDVMQKKNQELKARLQDFEKELKGKNENIEKLQITRESLEKELQTANSKVLELENLLNERQVIQGSPPKTSKFGMEELKFLLNREKEELSATAKENSIIRQSLNEILNKRTPESRVKQIEIEEITRKEREKWQDEKKNLGKDIQNRINKIIDLELDLDNSKQKYKNLEAMLSEGERALKRKTDTLERNLEQLTLMYNQLVSQKSQISVEKTLAEKRFSRVSETIKNLQDELEKCRNQLEIYQQKNEVLQNELKIMQETRNRSRKNTGNCLIAITGGLHSRTSSNFNKFNE
jgi:kinesin family protein 5